MTRYRVEVSPPADKELTAVRDRMLKTRLMRAIYALGDTPRPAGCVKVLRGGEKEERRSGDSPKGRKKGQAICETIEGAGTNPVKHGLVERLQDWPFSSVHQAIAEGKFA